MFSNRFILSSVIPKSFSGDEATQKRILEIPVKEFFKRVPSLFTEAQINHTVAAMKLLHTADLHLGKTLHEMSLLSVQEKMLDGIRAILTDTSYAALLIAGDIYDRAIPPAELFLFSVDSSHGYGRTVRKLRCLLFREITTRHNGLHLHMKYCKTSVFTLQIIRRTLQPL